MIDTDVLLIDCIVSELISMSKGGLYVGDNKLESIDYIKHLRVIIY